MNVTGERITGGILAGGQARRLGGVDKGWYEISGRPLIEHTLARLAPQCTRVLVSANRSLARYRRLCVPVYTDANDGMPGPLAGIARLLRAATTPWVLIVPVDTPLLPPDLAARLAGAMQPSTAIAIARSAQRIQPLHALMRRDVLADLEAARRAGVRGVAQWQTRLETVVVDWPEPAGFANINREADARDLGARL